MLFLAGNPYSGQDFFGFFLVLGKRIGTWSGPLASDEIQCLVLVLLSVSLSFLGSFLVVKKMTMIANALSHTLLLGIVGAFFLCKGAGAFSDPFDSSSVLWLGAVLTGLFTTLATETLIKRFRVPEDAGIGLVFTFLFALGIVSVTLFTKSMHLGTEAIMGNIDALHIDDVRSAFVCAAASVLIYCFVFRGFFAAAFDPLFARAVGFPVKTLDYLLMILTAAGAIASFRAIGVVLFLSLLTGPVLTVRLYTKKLQSIVFRSFLLGSGAGIVSVALSRHCLSVFGVALPTSGILASCIFVVYIVAFSLSRYRKAACKPIDL